MHAADAFWHLMNFCAPALGIGGFAVVLARIVWRGELRQRSLVALWAWASTAAVMAAVAGLALFERDGKMATYAAMVVACAGAIWWAGFRAAKR